MVFETLGFLSGITSFRPSECVFNLYAPAFACKECHSYTSDSQRLTRECEKIFKKKSPESLERKSKGSTFASAFDKESHSDRVRAKLEKDENTNE